MTEPRVMHLQNPTGLMLWPYDEIAMLRPERSGRLEATSSRGEVAHRPGPLADFAGPPWVEVAPDVLVHPGHARKSGKNLVLPGGWRIPFDGKLPRPTLPPLEPIIPELGVRPSEVLYLKIKSIHARYWMTDRGRIPASGPAGSAASIHPYLLPVEGAYVNRLRIRAILYARRPHLLLDDGTRIPLVFEHRAQALAGLGVPDMHYIESLVPGHRGLYLLGLRDWPFLISKADAAGLEAMFAGNERILMASMVWQTRELRARGASLAHGTSHRGYWYNPLRPVLQRAGVPLGAEPDDVVTLEAALGSAAPIAAIIPPDGAETRYSIHQPPKLRPDMDRYRYFTALLAAMVDHYRITTYQELGFEDPHPYLRAIGSTRPEVVLLVEKRTLSSLAFELAHRFGCSLIITSGHSKLIDTEYFAKALRAVHSGPVQVAAYVDFDAAGWIIAHAFQDHLARYGVKTESVRYLIRPHRFTPDELRNLSYRLSSLRGSKRTEITRWVEASGGIDGRAAGISADALRPIERLAAAFEEETGYAPLQKKVADAGTIAPQHESTFGKGYP